MKTTLGKLKDTIAGLLRLRLVQKSGAPATVLTYLKLPLVECAHEARPSEEMIPERTAEVLLEEDAGVHRDAV